MFKKDIGIDLGTANVLIHVKNKGIILNEPSVVAMDRNTKKILAVGEEANRMVGRTPENIVAIRPLKDGVIADYEATEAMLNYFINKLKVRGIFKKPRILICCPTKITAVEKKAIKEVAEKSGWKKVYLAEEPVAAAIGAGMKINEPTGNMVVDIGGGTADIAVLSLGGVVESASIKVAGNKFEQEILHHIKNKHKLLIGERTAEEIKKTIGTVYPGGRNEEMEIRGRDLVSGLPRLITITSEEVENSLRDSVSVIVRAAKNVLEKIPPELSADIIERGVVITGGGALLHGFDKLLAEELKIPVKVAENPMDCVALGAGIMVENPL
ncbi:rod shape-determining protein MreB [Rossellomorea aquimaris]|nr:rod shape-determining protein MreB [Rossellomorea aquimaris]